LSDITGRSEGEISKEKSKRTGNERKTYTASSISSGVPSATEAIVLPVDGSTTYSIQNKGESSEGPRGVREKLTSIVFPVFPALNLFPMKIPTSNSAYSPSRMKGFQSVRFAKTDEKVLGERGIKN